MKPHLSKKFIATLALPFLFAAALGGWWWWLAITWAAFNAGWACGIGVAQRDLGYRERTPDKNPGMAFTPLITVKCSHCSNDVLVSRGEVMIHAGLPGDSHFGIGGTCPESGRPPAMESLFQIGDDDD